MDTETKSGDQWGSLDGEAPISRLHVATAPVNWNNDDIDAWLPPVPFPAILDEMRSAGYAATEFGENFARDAATLKQELSSRSLALCGAYQWLPLWDHAQLERELAKLRPTMQLLRACECEHLIIADRLMPERVAIAGQVPEDGSRSLDAAGFRALTEGIAITAEAARQYNLRIHVHNHVGTYVETQAEVAAVVANLNTVAADLCFDTGHYAYGGGDPEKFVRDHAGLIGYIHIKDVDATVLKQARQKRWSFRDALRHHIFCPLGEGMVDIPVILAALGKSRFSGWVVVEQDTCPGDSTETAARNRHYLADCCGL